MRSLLHVFCLVSVLLTISCNREPAQSPSATPVAQATPTPETVPLLVSLLSSTDDDLRKQSEKRLIELGRNSTAERVAIIDELLRGAESQDDLRTGKCYILADKFNYWFSVTNIFAELKATEAIDLLITTIACGNGWGGSLLMQPSFDALSDLGNVAVPKLRKALKRERNEYVRIQLSHCLDSIYWKERN